MSIKSEIMICQLAAFSTSDMEMKMAHLKRIKELEQELEGMEQDVKHIDEVDHEKITHTHLR